MKIPRLERLAVQQRQYHRRHPWSLNGSGLLICHDYSDMTQEDFSWWDDGGFILNGRRIMLWWVHPRMRYQDEISEQAWRLVGPPPERDHLFSGGKKHYKKVGRSRKVLIGTSSRPTSPVMRDYYQKLWQTERDLEAQGIDFTVEPKLTVTRMDWAMGMDLVAPVEVRCEAEMENLLHLARALQKRETTLAREFPRYIYTKENWLAEQASIKATHERRLAASEG